MSDNLDRYDKCSQVLRCDIYSRISYPQMWINLSLDRVGGGIEVVVGGVAETFYASL